MMRRNLVRRSRMRRGSDYGECKSSYKEDCDDHNKLTPPVEKEHVFVKETLSLIFRFDDEEPLPQRKKNGKRKLKLFFLK
ncbi:hypothetical protein H5410_026478 [Solanum commersonii]|uniref:Uncharacterized protein n=1 Tax=Solanum commersonii TaxID=4109 RepID=A0A9J5YX63_SOLCO|nr:hypothetical protein H5410_026478 [Solanum commersonii]